MPRPRIAALHGRPTEGDADILKGLTFHNAAKLETYQQLMDSGGMTDEEAAAAIVQDENSKLEC